MACCVGQSIDSLRRAWGWFITLIGSVSRNGILMISHNLHLMEHEGESFGKEMIIRGVLSAWLPLDDLR